MNFNTTSKNDEKVDENDNTNEILKLWVLKWIQLNKEELLIQHHKVHL